MHALSIVVAGLARLLGEGPGQRVVEEARRLTAKIILPQRITGSLINKYFRKALQTGAWRSLAPQARALIYLARRWRGVFKSKLITSVLREILLDIELFSTGGKAIFYGVLLALKKGIESLGGFLLSKTRLLFMGLQYLNNPLIYRFYG